MPRHNPPFTLAPDAPIDLQLHTVHSDGDWTAEQLLDHVAAAGFRLVAVTDHDRVDTVAAVQRLGTLKGVPVLAAAELSSEWEGQPLDLLCYGFDPLQPGPLAALAATTQRAQSENFREMYATLQQQGYRFPLANEVFAAGQTEPRRLDDLIALLKHHGYAKETSAALRGAGFRWVTADPAEIVEAAHRSDALCLIAHPGRGNEFVRFDAPLLDRFRAAVPIDGLEARHPSHTPAQVELFHDYARQHGLLVSTGSDSHGPAGQLPIGYRAALSRELLARLGIPVR